MGAYAELLLDARWMATRQRIIARANGKCENCGLPTERFDVHHTKYIGTHPSDTPDEFLVALCRGCHDLPHWVERLHRYTMHKRSLVESGDFTPEIHQELIKKYEI